MPDQFPIRILILDDRQCTCDLWSIIGRGMGLLCFQAENTKDALELLENNVPELMVANLPIGKMSGLELLAEVKKRSPQTEVELVSAYGTARSAVETMRLGACEWIVEPFREEKVKAILERMVEKVRLVRENEYLRGRLQSKTELVHPAGLLCTDLEELERFTVRRVFEQVGGDKEKAQKLLGISRATLYRKIKRYGIQTQQARQKVPAQENRALARVILLSQS